MLSRRALLKGTAAVALAAALPPLPVLDRGKQAALWRDIIKQMRWATAYGAGPNKLVAFLPPQHPFHKNNPFGPGSGVELRVTALVGGGSLQ
jgi:hypothetical protein